MKKVVLLISIGVFALSCSSYAGDPAKPAVNSSAVAEAGVISLTNESFKQKVFNYADNKQWKYEGNMPAIVDFYANWCGPCRQLSPRLEEIAKEYAGKIVVYKVDTEKEKLLSQNLGISSLPTLLFIPVKGQPQAAMGALPKETLVRAIKEVLLVN